jgi:hypothetical protein
MGARGSDKRCEQRVVVVMRDAQQGFRLGERQRLDRRRREEN